MSKWLVRTVAIACCGTVWAAVTFLGGPRHALAQAATPEPTPEASTRALGAGSAPTGEGARVGGNYDYFTAHLRTDLQSYLSQVTARHASERVWAQYWAGKRAEPLSDCEYVLQRFPNHPRALHLIGEIAKATNNVSLGILAFENALSLYPQYAFTHAQYGHFLIGVGSVPAGVERLREALRLEPGQFQARAWLAQALSAHPELAGPTGEPPAPASSNNTP
jgi:tetratricopeptide (TPR) repeat protein